MQHLTTVWSWVKRCGYFLLVNRSSRVPRELRTSLGHFQSHSRQQVITLNVSGFRTLSEHLRSVGKILSNSVPNPSFEASQYANEIFASFRNAKDEVHFTKITFASTLKKLLHFNAPLKLDLLLSKLIHWFANFENPSMNLSVNTQHKTSKLTKSSVGVTRRSPILDVFKLGWIHMKIPSLYRSLSAEEL
ncbi:hypothetical protein Tco_1476021 [Tanacetum coccineum]